MEEYKKSEEWQALNNIYKSLPQIYNKAIYRTLKHYLRFCKKMKPLKTSNNYQKKELINDQYKYLNPLSTETQELILALIDEGEKNLYHSIMAVIGGTVTFKSVNEVWYYYS